MSDDKNLTPPNPSAGDRIYSLVRAALSAIPTLGGAASELLGMIVMPSLERRRQIWMENVGRGLAELLSKKLITLEELTTNDAFIDTVAQASLLAIKTANEEKHRVLKNAVLNSALPNPPEESLRLMFLSLVDVFTPWHIRLLILFQNPAEWARQHESDTTTYYMEGISGLLELAYPELSGKKEFYDQVWADLYQKGLVNTGNLHTLITSSGLSSKFTSELGDRFLHFLASPESLVGDA